MQFLRGAVVAAETYWFVASDEEGKYRVAEATGAALVKVIEGLFAFEYYVVDRDLRWIFCENHHGVFVRSNQSGSFG